MKKNGFLTFIFACIPGAGQMYYGYMQRGLSIAMMLMLCVMAATVIQPLGRRAAAAVGRRHWARQRC